MDIFIWTEAFNCGEILNPMIKSYLKHNTYPLHIFGRKEDFDEITINSSAIKMINLSRMWPRVSPIESRILNGYKKGHKGTAVLWEYIFRIRKEKIFIHLDADTIFLNEVISDLVYAIKVEGYAIAGSRRPYKFRDYRITDRYAAKLNSLPDTINTDCFAFNIDYVSKRPKFWLRRKITGKRVSLKPVIDFFDPVTFNIIKNGGKIKYMDSPVDGSSSIVNQRSEFMESRISFGGVGSGCNFYKNGHNKIPIGYSYFALSSYSLFASEFLAKDIGIPPLQVERLSSQLSKLDKENWILKHEN